MYKKLNVYDFDGTIYDGDSTVDFFLFSLKQNWKIIFCFPEIIIFYILYLLHFVSLTTFKSHFFCFLKKVKDLDSVIEKFWKTHEYKIQSFFLSNVETQKNIYVISASPEFLLAPYLKQWKKVHLIGSNVSKESGMLIGKNCKGEEKIKRLDENLKKYEIESFYSDSLADLPLAERSNQSFLVTKGKVEMWDSEKLVKRKNTKNALFILGFFFVFYMFISILFTYNYNWKDKFDVLFQMDTSRILDDMGEILSDHYRLTVHPLIVILIQPIIFLLKAITLDTKLAIMIFLAFTSACSVMMIYRFTCLFLKNELVKKLITLIFGFCFGNILFSASPELYNIAALSLISLWYLVAVILKDNKYDKKYDFLLGLLGVILLSVTITNFCVFLIACFILLLSKKIPFKKLVQINVLIALVVMFLFTLQNLAWHNTPMFFQENQVNITDESNWMNFHIGTQQIKNVVKGDIYNPIIAPSPVLEYNEIKDSMMIGFGKVSKPTIMLITLLFLLIFIFVVKNFKKNILLNLGLLLTFCFNVILHLIYGNSTSYLYMQHFLYIPFLFLIINYKEVKSKKIRFGITSFFALFLLLEIYKNAKNVLQIIRFLNDLLEHHYVLSHFTVYQRYVGSVIFIILFLWLICLGYRQLKKIFNTSDFYKKIKHIVYFFLVVVSTSAMFVGLSNIPIYNKVLWFDVRNEADKNYDFNHNKKTYKSTKDYLKSVLKEDGLNDFKKKYPVEIKSYEKYKNEYIEFVSKYQIQLKKETTSPKFYLFGMGDRKKILYKNGILKDLDTGAELYHFQVKYDLVIPNEYMVLMKTNTGKYIKLIEKGDGVHLIINDEDTIIPGTQKKIELYPFSNQKYQNLKKVLYQELLVNIKDGKVYPNFLSYDEVWYRDAAFAGMVLKNTNNISLIEDEIRNINKIYDMQNHGIKEPDNLGQLLYLQSLISNRNENLIDEITEEAKRISNIQKNGYLTGKTDGGNLFDYQNKWYRFGIDSLDKKTDIFYEGKDGYSSTTWWYPNSIGNEKLTLKDDNLSNYPYLAWGQYHTTRKGNLYIGGSLYPLSYEKEASCADYTQMVKIDSIFEQQKITPIHTWHATEILLFLLDETGDLEL